ncbi:ThiJ/PfpI [Panaeolus papilionaceus]|nr:ThiJ/PfpI [Panaeolus papilionaceus]
MVNPIWTIGVLLIPGFQLLDMAGTVDYMQTHSYDFLKPLQSGLHISDDVLAAAPIINWHYIAHDRAPLNATSGPPLMPTMTVDEAPKLDYLIVPGPDPSLVLPNNTITFVQNTFKDPQFKGLLTVCTGSMVLAQTGVLDGHHVASNKVALKEAAENGKINHNVTWVGDRRWVIDGKVWSSGGVTSGLDLAAAFLEKQLGNGQSGKGLRTLAQNIMEYRPNPDKPDPFRGILDGVKLN